MRHRRARGHRWRAECATRASLRDERGSSPVVRVGGCEVAGPCSRVQPSSARRRHSDRDPSKHLSVRARIRRETQRVLFAEIAGDLACDGRCLFDRARKVRDAARFPREALEQPGVFLFLRHPGTREPDGIDDRVGPARKDQYLRIRPAARVVTAVADDDERPSSAGVRARGAAALRRRRRTTPCGLQLGRRRARLPALSHRA